MLVAEALLPLYLFSTTEHVRCAVTCLEINGSIQLLCTRGTLDLLVTRMYLCIHH